MADALCHPGADPFIERYFLDCVYNLKDKIGFMLGMTSLLCWLVAQFPQFYANMKNQSAEALSPWFLAEWLLGDTSNLLGCLMTGEQLPTTTYTAMYFVVSDAVLMTQYIYYGALQKRRERILKAKRRRRSRSQQLLAGLDASPPEGAQTSATPTETPTHTTMVITPGVAKVTAAVAGALAFASVVCVLLPVQSSPTALHFPSRHLQSTSTTTHPKLGFHEEDPDADLAVWLGRGLGYLSSVFYMMARLSQIYKNHTRGTAKGLSPIMFCMAIVANLCQGSAIILRLQSSAELQEQLPWLLGSLGVVAMDMIIISQVVFFNSRKAMLTRASRSDADINQPLLHAA